MSSGSCSEHVGAILAPSTINDGQQDLSPCSLVCHGQQVLIGGNVSPCSITNILYYLSSSVGNVFCKLLDVSITKQSQSLNQTIAKHSEGGNSRVPFLRAWKVEVLHKARGDINLSVVIVQLYFLHLIDVNTYRYSFPIQGIKLCNMPVLRVIRSVKKNFVSRMKVKLPGKFYGFDNWKTETQITPSCHSSCREIVT